MNILTGFRSIQGTVIKEKKEKRGGSMPGNRVDSRNKRRIEILRLCKISSRTVDELVNIFGVTNSAIRDDFVAMKKEGLIKNISEGRGKLVIAI